ncbi:hypothetical protein [Actinacidiphila soli]|uniref:hypothetical protein n=1 Tax=Actinacidiphila soli TaxID=2487275 RepID=UPI000FC9A838|nr:hypothetical protein [Actinacidiphila soli]
MHIGSWDIGSASGYLLALVPVGVGWGLATWSTAQSQRRSDREALQKEIDAFVQAVLDLRIAGRTHDFLWAGKAERFRSFILVGVAAIAGAAQASGSEGRRMGAGFTEAVRVLAAERLSVNQSAAMLQAPLSRLTAAASPLMRSEHRTLAAATEQLLLAVENIQDEAALEEASRAFGDASQEALNSTWWKRLRRRRAARA